MKTIHKILLVLAVLVTFTGLLAYDAFFVSTKRYSVRYETLSSILIPDQMDNVTICFFSDLEYGKYMDETRLTHLVETVNDLSPDVIIFGGDLVYEGCNSVSDVSTLTSLLSDLKAPLGKFAVLGDNDHLNENLTNQIEQIFYDADFEVLDNRSLFLRNEGSGSITLTGLDSPILGNADVSGAYSNVSRTTYNITVCHIPDEADEVPSDLTNYFLAGHSHGGEVYWGFQASYMPEGCDSYFRGKNDTGSFTLDITNGVSTTVNDVRFMADQEVVLYRLKHVSIR